MNSRKSSLTSCRSLIALVAFVVMAASSLLVGSPASAAGKKTKIDTPIINCGATTAASIDIVVCAPAGTGATGLPAGFSLQWMTCAAFAANGNQWLSSDDPGLCHASFSGNANLSRYNLAPGECVTVNVGDFLFDEGASTNCPDSLVCGTCYVFRAFGHATSTLNRSDFTANKECSTLNCNDVGGCTFTQGYWKTHGPTGCNPSGGANVWPADVLTNGLTLGSVNYTADQLCSIFNTQPAGNGLLALAHQLIAAKINIANGSDGTAVAQCIADADTLIGALIIPPVGSGSLSAAATNSLTTCLKNYNEGATGPGHCPQ
jgi:hypothetical protein